LRTRHARTRTTRSNGYQQATLSASGCLDTHFGHGLDLQQLQYTRLHCHLYIWHSQLHIYFVTLIHLLALLDTPQFTHGTLQTLYAVTCILRLHLRYARFTDQRYGYMSSLACTSPSYFWDYFLWTPPHHLHTDPLVVSHYLHTCTLHTCLPGYSCDITFGHFTPWLDHTLGTTYLLMLVLVTCCCYAVCCASNNACALRLLDHGLILHLLRA